MWKQNAKSVSRYTSSDELIGQCLDWKRQDAQEGGRKVQCRTSADIGSRIT